MPDFPVIEDELEAAEAALGIRLPDVWKEKLLDPRIRRALQDKKVKALRPGDSMAKFVELTHRIRQEQPEFPRDAVVMSCGQDESGRCRLDRGGFVRVCLPDKRDPTKLADYLHSWDLVRRRLIRDCSTQDWIDSEVGAASKELLDELGIVPRNPWGEPKPLATRACPSQLIDLLEGRTRFGARAWIACGEFRVSGRFLTPCDLGQCPSSGHPSVEVTPGVYECWLEVDRVDGRDWPIVITTRLILQGAGERSRVTAARVDVDLAAVAIFDRQTFFKAVRSWDRDSFGEQLMGLTSPPMFVAVNRNSELFVTPSGRGDGAYPVFALTDGTRPVGLEISFVE